MIPEAPTQLDTEHRIAARKAAIMKRRGHVLDDELLEQLILAETKQRIQSAVRKAIELGLLTRRPCEECGEWKNPPDARDGIRAHHIDYNRPLLIQWLCGRCHRRWHVRNDAVPPDRAIMSHHIKDYLILGVSQEFATVPEPVAAILNREAERRGIVPTGPKA